MLPEAAQPKAKSRVSPPTQRMQEVSPSDEVVEAAKAVAERMPREHRCTALGGLSDTPTSRSIEQRLAAARGCGAGGCGCG